MAVFTQRLIKSFDQLLARRFRLFSFATVTVIVLVSLMTFLWPKLTEIRDVGLFDLQRTREKLAVEQEILQATKALVAKYQQFNTEDLEKLRNILPDEPDLPTLFVQVEALALAAHLNLNSVGFADLAPSTTTTAPATQGLPEEKTVEETKPIPVVQAAELPAGIKHLNVNFTVSGGQGYGNLKDFLATIESSLRLLDIQSLSYAPDLGGEQEESYQIRALTYYFPR